MAALAAAATVVSAIAVICAALITVAWGYDRPPMSADRPDGLASCAECHMREGNSNTLALREDRDCAACHEEIAGRVASSPYGHPGVGESGRAACLECHAFHDARAHFLPGDPIESCAQTNCHPDQLGEGSHPVGGIDPRTGQRMTCTSHCHDPHGSRFKWFCKSPPGRDLCVGCHEEMR